VKEMLGQGTFGQVVKCWDAETSSYVAVKVIKNQHAYTQQAVVEVSILDTVKYSLPSGGTSYSTIMPTVLAGTLLCFHSYFFSARILMLKPELKHIS
jgi:serine/threonine protein kinase